MLIQKIIEYIFHRYSNYLNDTLYSQFRYYLTFERFINLLNPKSFNDKIQWIKLFDRNKIRATFADKYLMRSYVEEKVGAEYLPQLLWYGKDPEEIDFTQLPEKFVVKANHASGTNLIVKDKDSIDKKEIINKCKNWLEQDYYKRGREWAYKNINRKIIIEEYLENRRNGSLLDYKMFVCNGDVKFIQVDIDRFKNHRRNLYTPNWEFLPYDYIYKRAEQKIKKPDRLKEMIKIASRLGEEVNFVRVDLYNLDEKVYVGELTNYPENGFGKFQPTKADFKLGEMLAL